MAIDWTKYRVELRRHVGYAATGLGVVPFEHPQKMVLVHLPDALPGMPPLKQIGYLPDYEGAQLLPLFDVWEEIPSGLRTGITAEAERLKQAGEFSDPPAL